MNNEIYSNYRVVKKGNLYGIHEVRYTPEGKIDTISLNPRPVEAGAREDLKWLIRMMEANWCLPPIDFVTKKEIYE